jgi:hypothetical protein
MWFGMTTKASRSMPGKWTDMSVHIVAANCPAAFQHIAPSTTSPNRQARPCVQIVMKYAPACA